MFLFSSPYQRQLLAMAPGGNKLFRQQKTVTAEIKMFAAYMIMICGGMFLSYGIFTNFIGYQVWIVGMSTLAIFFVAGSFHIALIFGALATSLIYNQLEIFKIHVSHERDFKTMLWGRSHISNNCFEMGSLKQNVLKVA